MSNMSFNKIRKIIGFLKSSLKYKFIGYLLMISVVPIVILGVVLYKETERITRDRSITASMSIVSDKMRSFDLSNKYIFESFINSHIYHLETFSWLEGQMGENVKIDEDFYSYTISLLVSSKLDNFMSQHSDLVRTVVLIPNNPSIYMQRGSMMKLDLDSLRHGGKIYEETAKDPYKTHWTYVDSTEDPRNGRHIRIARAVYDMARSKSYGLILIYLNMDYPRNFFASPVINNEDRSFEYLIDDRGKIIYSSTGDDDLNYIFSDETFIGRLQGNYSGNFDYKISKNAYNVTYITSDTTGWKFINITPHEVIRKDIQNVSYVSILFTLICFVYAIFIAVLIFRDIFLPIKDLIFATRQVGKGDFNVKLRSNRTDELGILSSTFNTMTNQIKQLIEDIELQEKKKKETEIKFLQSQIMPHFLYNTLNTVKVLARTNRTSEISEIIVSLIKLLRVSVSSSNDLITIEEEIGYVESYIKIMAFRYEKKLNVSYVIPEEYKCYGILKFIIQPIVENCIIHAFNETNESCDISIHVYAYENKLAVRVSDNGVGFDADSLNKILNEPDNGSNLKFSKIGLKNINDRIKLNYGNDYGVKVFSNVGEGTSVVVLIPKISPEHDVFPEQE